MPALEKSGETCTLRTQPQCRCNTSCSKLVIADFITSQLFGRDRRHSTRVCCANTLCGGERSRAAWYLGFNPRQQRVAFCGQISKGKTKKLPGICALGGCLHEIRNIFQCTHWMLQSDLAAARCSALVSCVFQTVFFSHLREDLWVKL